MQPGSGCGRVPVKTPVLVGLEGAVELTEFGLGSAGLGVCSIVDYFNLLGLCSPTSDINTATSSKTKPKASRDKCNFSLL